MDIQVKVINEINNRSFGSTFSSLEEANAWLDRQEAKKTFGKPERIMIESEMSEMEKRRVKSSSTREDGVREFVVKADYVITLQEITTYAQDRMEEYPSIQEIIEAVMENFEGRPQKLTAIRQKRELVRRKYPKTANGEITRR